MGLKKNEKESFMEKVVFYFNSIGILAQESGLLFGSWKCPRVLIWNMGIEHISLLKVWSL